MTSQLLQPILIRTAQADDLQQLLALESKCFQTDLISRRSFRSFIKTDSSRLLVAVDEHDQLLGYAAILLRLGSSVARIYSLGVDPDAQGRGIGAQLIGGAESIARENGCTSLSLEVRTDNDRASSSMKSTVSSLRPNCPPITRTEPMACATRVCSTACRVARFGEPHPSADHSR